MRPENIHKSVVAKEEEAATAAVVPSFFKCPISLELSGGVVHRTKLRAE
jgi:hypothetical protein